MHRGTSHKSHRLINQPILKRGGRDARNQICEREKDQPHISQRKPNSKVVKRIRKGFKYWQLPKESES